MKICFKKKKSSPFYNLCELVDDEWMRKEKQPNTMNEWMKKEKQ
jgi:hypothetical protein